MIVLRTIEHEHISLKRKRIRRVRQILRSEPRRNARNLHNRRLEQIPRHDQEPAVFTQRIRHALDDVFVTDPRCPAVVTKGAPVDCWRVRIYQAGTHEFGHDSRNSTCFKKIFPKIASRRLQIHQHRHPLSVFLPSISAVVHWTHALQSHFSVAKTQSQPGFASLNPALSEIPPTVNRQGNGGEGNPNLSAITATAYDATLEYYAPSGGMAAIEAFYRTVTGYIEPETLTVPYSQSYCAANGIPLTGGAAGQCNVLIGTAVSSGKGFINGIDIEGQKFFNFLPAPFNGFGVEANYSWINSGAPIPGQNGLPTTIGQLTNVSKNNGSLILMFDKYRLNARLAATYRSKYIESYYPGNDTYPPIDVVRPTVVVDLSLYYHLTKHFAITAAATNLTNAYYNSYSGTPLFPRDIRLFDRTYRIGFHYNLD